jgi:hypothetical protein
VRWTREGAIGLSCSLIGLGILLFTSFLAYDAFARYQQLQPPADLGASMGSLLFAAVRALFLAIMGWTGSLLLLRGLDYLKVERSGPASIGSEASEKRAS